MQQVLAFQFRDKNTPVFFRTWRDILRSRGVADAALASVFEPYSREFLLVRGSISAPNTLPHFMQVRPIGRDMGYFSLSFLDLPTVRVRTH